MKIAVISDLHLGAGDGADTFGHDELGFLRFLSFLESNFEKVVLLGDIWETLTGKGYGNVALALRKARAAYPQIARRFAGERYVYVHGNHDLVAGVTDRAPDELELHLDGTRLLFTHGHYYDVLIRKARWLSEMGIWLGGWMLRMRLGPVYSMFNCLDGYRTGIAEDGSRCTFQKWAMRVAESRGADVLVTGHTHFANRTEHDSTLYLNSGSCANGNYSYLSLDTGAGNYGVHSSW